MFKGKRGYSLFELIILVVVLGVVCYFIFLNQESFSGQNPDEMEMIAVEMVRIGIHNYAVESKKLERTPPYPLDLDEAKDGDVASEKSPLFTTIIKPGIRTGWKKMRRNQYVYLPTAGNTTKQSAIYYYDPASGTFEKGKVPGGSQSRVV